MVPRPIEHLIRDLSKVAPPEVVRGHTRACASA